MPFTPIRTARLLIRPMRLEDAEGLWRRRSDPEVARYQNWALPYPRERAEELVKSVVAMDGPANDEWWMAAIADPDTDEVVGDLALHLGWESRSAEIGYTLAREHWGKGYAIEAASDLVAYLFGTVGVTRVFGMLHPENPASAMVLERLGMVFEGHTRSSFWVGDEVSDDWLYGMTRADWEAWRDRPRTLPTTVRLLQITADNWREVVGLRTHKTQESMVATVERSLAQVLVPPIGRDGGVAVPWYRAIEADGVIVGFVMVALDTATRPDPYLWRFLIDRMHQRRGIGGRALDIVEAEMRSRGAKAIGVSYVVGKGGPAPFYAGRGYEPTGEVSDGETVARKVLD